MKYALMMLLAVFSAGAQAAIDVRDFDTPLQETRYRALIDELRCPKCQNTNLAGSDAGLAGDLKDRVYEQVKAGQSDGEIRDYLIARYGDFITYKPPMRGWLPALSCGGERAGGWRSRNRYLRKKLSSCSACCLRSAEDDGFECGVHDTSPDGIGGRAAGIGNDILPAVAIARWFSGDGPECAGVI